MTVSICTALDRSRDKFRLFLTLALIATCTPVVAQPRVSTAIDRAAGQRAVASLAKQGVMRDAPETKADAPIPRGEFATALQLLFALSAPNREIVFPDVARGSANYEAIQAVAPFLQRQMRCPGCALTTTIGVDQPIDEVEAAVTVTSILLAQGKTAMVSSSRAGQLLRTGRRSAPLTQPLRIYLATAINAGALRSSFSAVPDTPARFTRADLALMLQGVQRRYRIPLRSIPR